MERTVNARLSADAYEGWQRLADHAGASMSALLEACGLVALEHAERAEAGELVEAWDVNGRVLAMARRITAERRRGRHNNHD